MALTVFFQIQIILLTGCILGEQGTIEPTRNKIRDVDPDDTLHHDLLTSCGKNGKTLKDKVDALYSRLRSMSLRGNGKTLKPKSPHRVHERKEALQYEEPYSDFQGIDKPYLTNDRQKRNLWRYNKFWPKNIVPYEIDSSIKNVDHRNAIKKAVSEMNNATCVQWLERSNEVASAVGHANYIRMYDGGGCSSGYGYKAKSPQYLSLTPGCFWNEKILHEMMHAMGFTHEASRWDTIKYLTVNFKYIKDIAKRLFETTSTINLTPYDLESVMQYSLTMYGIGNHKTMTLRDKNLEFIVGQSKHLTYYDVADILLAYNCSASCDKLTSPKCKFGILNHKCQCHCMRGFTGQNCESIITDPGCGGYVNVTFRGSEKYITSTNYPNRYPTGKVCRWVISNSQGYFPRLVIEDLRLTKSDVLFRCNHWLEIQYNLPGQTGIRKCGEINDETWIASMDSGGVIIVTFDSKFVSSLPAQRGLRLRIDAIGKGCMSNPCVYGRCVEGDNDSDFKCHCDEGFEGKLCNNTKDNPNFKCSFEAGFKCIFQNQRFQDFNWTIAAGPSFTPATGPNQAYKGMYYILAEMSQLLALEDMKGSLVSTVKLPATKMCLKFHFCMYGRTVKKLIIYVKGSGKKRQVWSQVGNQGDKWKKAAINIPATKGLQIIIEAVRGKGFDSDIALDEISLRGGKCHEEYSACINTARGKEYKGTLNVTESGYTCQAWNSQTPHNHSYGDKVGDNSVNYCRNPGNDDRPWCYTTSSSKRFEYCNVPRCEFDDCLRSVIGYEYQGTVSTTKSGKTCQRWDSQTPHSHEFRYLKEHENYCRNPKGGKSAPWCLTTDNSTMWEFCDIPACPPTYVAKNCKETVQGIEFFGTVSKTASGKTCQSWNASSPVSHTFGKIGEQANYCRNPDGHSKPWCYTTDPKKRWETCNIPLCEDLPCSSNPCKNGGTCSEDGTSYRCTCPNPVTGPNCEKYVRGDDLECTRTTIGWDYKGTKAVTKDGEICKDWSKTRFAYRLHYQKNYCRNPDKEPRPWCYIDSGWKFCNITACKTSARECFDILENVPYFGKINIDKNGFKCQKWDSDLPRKRGYGYMKDQGNYCRNVGDDSTPWCFTTNPDKEREECDIPYC